MSEPNVKSWKRSGSSSSNGIRKPWCSVGRELLPDEPIPTTGSEYHDGVLFGQMKRPQEMASSCRLKIEYATCMVRIKDVLNDVLSLAREERAELVLRVLESLAGPDPRSSEEWVDEVERRARAAMVGAPGRDFDEVIAGIEAELE
jgi:hypothetical protein